ncbi:vWA domain-containing protein [Parafrankia discariae]|uniref:vWA domain-containing protein n=1 Tax=Parafrankia discariae TaxID=365528 RepID=UPI000376C51C|nr:VWA domain-containing protein [Parafrankia discariae]
MTRLGELQTAAAPWSGRPDPLVLTDDRADLAVWEQTREDCPALASLDADLTDRYGIPGLARDLWLAAYARDPHVADTADVEPARLPARAILAAQAGTPEQRELRRISAGDPYAAAMGVLAQSGALHQMLATLDKTPPRGPGKEARRQLRKARREAAAAAEAVREALANAEDDVDDDPGGEVSRPLSVDVQRAVAEAEGADADATTAAQAAQEAGVGEDGGDLTVARLRAAARTAAAGAETALAAEAAVMTGWGVEPGQLERLDAGERMRLAEKMRGGKLAAFAALIGRFRQMATAQRARRVEHAKGEYVGVTLGDDLAALVPDELVALAVPALRAQFAIRYADRQLMVYDQRGIDHDAQGAIIAVVDCSTSMTNWDTHGLTGEAYAKALALALLDSARAARPVRAFAGILFASEPIDPIVFPADLPVDLGEQIRFAETFPGGGTVFAPALDAAAGLLEAEFNATGRAKADIVIITDGAAELEPAWITAWKARRHRLGFRVFAVTVGDWADDPADLEAICDDVRRVADLTDTRATADLFRAI